MGTEHTNMVNASVGQMENATVCMQAEWERGERLGATARTCSASVRERSCASPQEIRDIPLSFVEGRALRAGATYHVANDGMPGGAEAVAVATHRSRALSVFVAIVMALLLAMGAMAVAPQQAHAAIASGGMYQNLYWEISDTGVLTIRPTSAGNGYGRIADNRYTPEDPASQSTDPKDKINSWPWKDHRDAITEVKVQGTVGSSPSVDLTWMFANMPNVTKIDISGFNFATDASGNVVPNRHTIRRLDDMFSGCTSLKEIVGLETLAHSSVTCTNRMFKDCTSLTTANFNALDMSNVQKAIGMFQNCSSLTELDLSNWTNSGKMQQMQDLAAGCTSLKKFVLNNPGFQTRVVNTAVNASNYPVTNASGAQTQRMFGSSASQYNNACSALEEIDISGITISTWKDPNGGDGNQETFVRSIRDLENLRILNMNDIKLPGLKAGVLGGELVYHKEKLEEFYFGGDIDIDDAINDPTHDPAYDSGLEEIVDKLIENCNSLRVVDLSGWDTSKLSEQGDVNGEGKMEYTTFGFRDLPALEKLIAEGDSRIWMHYQEPESSDSTISDYDISDDVTPDELNKLYIDWDFNFNTATDDAGNEYVDLDSNENDAKTLRAVIGGEGGQGNLAPGTYVRTAPEPVKPWVDENGDSRIPKTYYLVNNFDYSAPTLYYKQGDGAYTEVEQAGDYGDYHIEKDGTYGGYRIFSRLFPISESANGGKTWDDIQTAGGKLDDNVKLKIVYPRAATDVNGKLHDVVIDIDSVTFKDMDLIPTIRKDNAGNYIYKVDSYGVNPWGTGEQTNAEGERYTFTRTDQKRLVGTNPTTGQFDGTQTYTRELIGALDGRLDFWNQIYTTFDGSRATDSGAKKLSKGSGTYIDYSITVDDALPDTSVLYWVGDLDVAHSQEWNMDLSDMNKDTMKSDIYGPGAEGIVLRSGNDLSTLTLANNTGLKRYQYDDSDYSQSTPSESGNYIVGSATDPDTSWSRFYLRADSQGSDYTWTSGISCKTTILRNSPLEHDMLPQVYVIPEAAKTVNGTTPAGEYRSSFTFNIERAEEIGHVPYTYIYMNEDNGENPTAIPATVDLPNAVPADYFHTVNNDTSVIPLPVQSYSAPGSMYEQDKYDHPYNEHLAKAYIYRITEVIPNNSESEVMEYNKEKAIHYLQVIVSDPKTDLEMHKGSRVDVLTGTYYYTDEYPLPRKYDDINWDETPKTIWSQDAVLAGTDIDTGEVLGSAAYPLDPTIEYQRTTPEGYLCYRNKFGGFYNYCYQDHYGQWWNALGEKVDASYVNQNDPIMLSSSSLGGKKVYTDASGNSYYYDGQAAFRYVNESVFRVAYTPMGKQGAGNNPVFTDATGKEFYRAGGEYASASGGQVMNVAGYEQTPTRVEYDADGDGKPETYTVKVDANGTRYVKVPLYESGTDTGKSLYLNPDTLDSTQPLQVADDDTVFPTADDQVAAQKRRAKVGDAEYDVQIDVHGKAYVLAVGKYYAVTLKDDGTAEVGDERPVEDASFNPDTSDRFAYKGKTVEYNGTTYTVKTDALGTEYFEVPGAAGAASTYRSPDGEKKQLNPGSGQVSPSSTDKDVEDPFDRSYVGKIGSTEYPCPSGDPALDGLNIYRDTTGVLYYVVAGNAYKYDPNSGNRMPYNPNGKAFVVNGHTIYETQSGNKVRYYRDGENCYSVLGTILTPGTNFSPAPGDPVVTGGYDIRQGEDGKLFYKGEGTYRPDGTYEPVYYELTRNTDGTYNTVGEYTVPDANLDTSEAINVGSFENTAKISEIEIKKETEDGKAGTFTFGISFDSNFEPTNFVFDPVTPLKASGEGGTTPTQFVKQADGSYRFTLVEGQKVTIKNVPFQTTYTVTEPVEANGWELVSVDGDTSSVVASNTISEERYPGGDTSAAQNPEWNYSHTFTNRFTELIVNKVRLSVDKNDEFNFSGIATITSYRPNSEITYGYMQGDERVFKKTATDADGHATISLDEFTLKGADAEPEGSDDIVLVLPRGASVVLSETPTDAFTTSWQVEGESVKPVNSKGETDSIVMDEDKKHVTFYNTSLMGTAGIDLTKYLDGRAYKEGDEFTFMLTAEDGTPMPVKFNAETKAFEPEATTVDADTTTAVGTVSADAGFKTFKYTMADLDAVEVTYSTATEAQKHAAMSWSDYDEKDVVKTPEKWTYNGTEYATEAEAKAAVDAATPAGETPDYSQIVHTDVTYEVDKAESWSYGDVEYATQAEATAAAEADGANAADVVHNPVTYKKEKVPTNDATGTVYEKTFTYTIEENPRDSASGDGAVVTNDSRRPQVKLYVLADPNATNSKGEVTGAIYISAADENGEFVTGASGTDATLTYKEVGEGAWAWVDNNGAQREFGPMVKAQPVYFTNEYASEGTWTPTAVKDLANRPLERDQFSFMLTAGNAQDDDNVVSPLATAEDDEAGFMTATLQDVNGGGKTGPVTFENIIFTNEDLKKETTYTEADAAKLKAVNWEWEADGKTYVSGPIPDDAHLASSLTVDGVSIPLATTYAEASDAVRAAAHGDSKDTLWTDGSKYYLAAAVDSGKVGYYTYTPVAEKWAYGNQDYTSESAAKAAVDRETEAGAEPDYSAIVYTPASVKKDFTELPGSAKGTYYLDTRTFNYTLQEVKPNDASAAYTYDETTRAVAVTIKDKGDGTIEISEVKVDNNEVNANASLTTFKNEYKAKGNVDIKLTKLLEGRAFKEGDEFTFTLKTVTEGAPMPEGSEENTEQTTVYEKVPANQVERALYDFEQEGTVTYDPVMTDDTVEKAGTQVPKYVITYIDYVQEATEADGGDTAYPVQATNDASPAQPFYYKTNERPLKAGEPADKYPVAKDEYGKDKYQLPGEESRFSENGRAAAEAAGYEEVMEGGSQKTMEEGGVTYYYYYVPTKLLYVVDDDEATLADGGDSERPVQKLNATGQPLYYKTVTDNEAYEGKYNGDSTKQVVSSDKAPQVQKKDASNNLMYLATKYNEAPLEEGESAEDYKPVMNGDVQKTDASGKPLYYKPAMDTVSITKTVTIGSKDAFTDATTGTKDTVSFDTITVTHEDFVDADGSYLGTRMPDGTYERTFIYEITETKPAEEAKGVTPDSSKVLVAITVAEDNEGNITVVAVNGVRDSEELSSRYPGWGFTVDEPGAYPNPVAHSIVEAGTFTNEYDAAGDLDLNVNKVLKNGSLAGKDFTFLLKQKKTTPATTIGGEPTITWTTIDAAQNNKADKNATSNIATAAVKFNTLIYNLAQVRLDADEGLCEHTNAVGAQPESWTYTYELSEFVPSTILRAEGMTYDETKYYAKVVLTDKGDGTLVSTVTYYKDADCKDKLTETVPDTSEGAAEGATETVDATKVTFTNTLPETHDITVRKTWLADEDVMEDITVMLERATIRKVVTKPTDEAGQEIETTNYHVVDKTDATQTDSLVKVTDEQKPSATDYVVTLPDLDDSTKTAQYIIPNAEKYWAVVSGTRDADTFKRSNFLNTESQTVDEKTTRSLERVYKDQPASNAAGDIYVYRVYEDNYSLAYGTTYNLEVPGANAGTTASTANGVFYDKGTLVIVNDPGARGSSAPAAVKQLIGREWNEDEKFTFSLEPIGKAQYYTSTDAGVQGGIPEGKVVGDIKVMKDAEGNPLNEVDYVRTASGPDKNFPTPGEKGKTTTAEAVSGSNPVGEGEYLATFGNINFEVADLAYDENDKHMQGDFYYRMYENIPDDAMSVDENGDPIKYTKDNTTEVYSKSTDGSGGQVKYGIAKDAFSEGRFPGLDTRGSVYWMIPKGETGYNGIIYDGTIHNVHVRVRENRTEDLQIGVIYDETDVANPNSGTRFTPVFANHYVATGEAAPTLEKRIMGRDWQEGDKFDFMMNAIGGAPFNDAKPNEFADKSTPTSEKYVTPEGTEYNSADAVLDAGLSYHTTEGAHVKRLTVGETDKDTRAALNMAFPALKFELDDLHLVTTENSGMYYTAEEGAQPVAVPAGMKYGKFMYAVEEVAVHTSNNDLGRDADAEYVQVTVIDKGDGTLDMQTAIFEDRYGKNPRFVPDHETGEASTTPAASVTFVNQLQRNIKVTKTWIGPALSDVRLKLEYNTEDPKDATKWHDASDGVEWLAGVDASHTIAREATGKALTVTFENVPGFANIEGEGGTPDDYDLNDSWVYYRVVEVEAEDGIFDTYYDTEYNAAKTYGNADKTPKYTEAEDADTFENTFAVINNSEKASGTAQVRVRKELSGRDWKTKSDDNPDSFDETYTFIMEPYGEGALYTYTELLEAAKAKEKQENPRISDEDLAKVELSAEDKAKVGTLKLDDDDKPIYNKENGANVTTHSKLPGGATDKATATTTTSGTGATRRADFTDITYTAGDLNADANYTGEFFYKVYEDIPADAIALTAVPVDAQGDPTETVPAEDQWYVGTTLYKKVKSGNSYVTYGTPESGPNTTYTYWVDLKTTGKKGITYTSTPQIVHVRAVFNASTGKVDTTVKYGTVDGKVAEEVLVPSTFVNTYGANGSYMFYTIKRIVGREFKESDKFQFKLTPIANAAMNPSDQKLVGGAWLTPVLTPTNATMTDEYVPETAMSDAQAKSHQIGDDKRRYAALAGQGNFWLFELRTVGQTRFVYELTELERTSPKTGEGYTAGDLHYNTTPVYLRILISDGGDGELITEGAFFSDVACTKEIKDPLTGEVPTVPVNKYGIYDDTSQTTVPAAQFSNSTTLDIDVQKVWIGMPVEDVEVELQRALIPVDAYGRTSSNLTDDIVDELIEAGGWTNAAGRTYPIKWLDTPYTHTIKRGEFVDENGQPKNNAHPTETGATDPYEGKVASTFTATGIAGFNKDLRQYEAGDDTIYRIVYRLIERDTSSAYTRSYKSIQPDGTEKADDQVFIDSGTLVVENTTKATNKAYVAAVKQLMNRDWEAKDAFTFKLDPLGKAKYDAEGDLVEDTDNKTGVALATTTKDGETVVDTKIPMPAGGVTVKVDGKDVSVDKDEAKATSTTARVADGERLARFGEITYNADDLVYNGASGHLHGDFYYAMTEELPAIVAEGENASYPVAYTYSYVEGEGDSATTKTKTVAITDKKLPTLDEGQTLVSVKWNDGITYDMTEYIVQVHVEENRTGQLLVNVIYSGDSTDSETAGTNFTPVYTNYYHSTAELQLPVDKIIDGAIRTWREDDSFKFQLRSISEAPMPANADANKVASLTFGNSGDGVTSPATNIRQAKFGAITYTEDQLFATDANGKRFGTFYYVITEVIPDDATNADGKTYGTRETTSAVGPWVKNNLTYTESSVYVMVYVEETDASSGTLTATPYYYTELLRLPMGKTGADTHMTDELKAAAFTNVGAISARVTKTWQGDPVADVTVDLQKAILTNEMKREDGGIAPEGTTTTAFTVGTATYDVPETAWSKVDDVTFARSEFSASSPSVTKEIVNLGSYHESGSPVVYRIVENDLPAGVTPTYGKQTFNPHAGSGAGEYTIDDGNFIATPMTVTNKYAATAKAQVNVVKQLLGREWNGQDSYNFTLTARGGATYYTDDDVPAGKQVGDFKEIDTRKAIPLPGGAPGTSTTAAQPAVKTRENQDETTYVVAENERLATFADIEYKQTDLQYNPTTGFMQGDFFYTLTEVIPNEAKATIKINSVDKEVTYANAASEGATAEQIKDAKWEHNGVTYDTSSHRVHVRVTDTLTGEINVSVGYDETTVGDASTGTQFTPVFINRYTADGVDKIAIKKTMKERAITANTFTFNLEPLAGAPAPEGMTGNHAEITLGESDSNVATAEFADITFDKTGTFLYEVYEKLPSGVGADGLDTANNVLYDTRHLFAQVTVTEKETPDGSFKVDVKYYTNSLCTEEYLITEDADGNSSTPETPVKQAPFTNRELRDLAVTKAWVGDPVADVEITLEQSTDGTTWTAVDTATIAKTAKDDALTAKFDDMPAYDANGTEIKYRATEAVPTGADFTTDAPEGTGKPLPAMSTTTDRDKVTVTNTNTSKITFNGTKVWVDYNNAYDTRPKKDGETEASNEALTLTLHRSYGSTTDEVVNGATPTWAGNVFTYADLPAFIDGKAVTYWVTETRVARYDAPAYANAAGTSPTRCDNGGTITNTLTQQKISIEATKVWIHGDNPQTDWPSSAKIDLKANGTTTQSITVDGTPDTGGAGETAAWTATFANLDKYDADRAEITYTIGEDTVPSGYTCAVTGNVTDGFTVTNTYNPHELDDVLKVHKTITGENDWITAAAADTVDEEGHTVLGDAAAKQGKWPTDSTFVFDLLPVSNTAGVTTPMPQGTVTEGETYKRAEIDDKDDPFASFGKIVYSKAGTYIYRVREITPAASAVDRIKGMTYDTQAYTVTVTVADDLTISTQVIDREGNPVTADPTTGVYDLVFNNSYNPDQINYIMEAEKSYVDVSDSTVGAGDVKGYFTFTMRPIGANAATAPMPTDYYTNESRTGLQGSGANRVYFATNNGNRVLFEADRDHALTFTKDMDGNTYSYELAEVIPDTALYVEDGIWYNEADQVFYDGVIHTRNLTVTYAGGVVNVTPSVQHDDWYLDPERGTVYGDVKNTQRSETETWKKWEPTPEQASQYPRHHNNVPQFINSRDAVQDVVATKVWDDANNQDGVRPATGVTLQIARNDGATVVDAIGKPVTTTITLDGTVDENGEAEAWKATWAMLPQYKRTDNAQGTPQFQKIGYTVTETTMPEGYTVAITGSDTEGFTVTNTHAPAVRDVVVAKVWDDGNNVDNVRPASVTFHLDQVQGNTTVADFKAEQTATASSSWKAEWRGLPAKKGGTDVTYSLREDAISGYKAGGFVKGATTLRGTITWDSGVTPPEGVVLNLVNGTQTGSYTVKAADNWTHEFTLPPDANPADYTITASALTGGTLTVAQVDNFTIANKHETAKTSVTATKVWDDADN
ncbi:MAG TPA: hypothetical protein DCP91_06060, partial [Eggerthellaceae bacterium]|nr:hypothetical protein [Eggerthellaceae bacterium]